MGEGGSPSPSQSLGLAGAYRGRGEGRKVWKRSEERGGRGREFRIPIRFPPLIM